MLDHIEFLQASEITRCPLSLTTPTHSCPGAAYTYVLAIIIDNSMNNETPVNNLLEGGPGVMARRVECEPHPPSPGPLSWLPLLPLVLASL